MTTTTAAGTSLAISTGTPATFDRAGYAALAYDEVGGVEKIGTIGRVHVKTEFQALRRAKDKLKGTPDRGALQPSMAYDDADVGQNTLRAAAADSTTRLYPVRVILPTGETRYFRGRVFGAPEGVEGADAVVMTTATIEVCTPFVRIGVGLPTFTTAPSMSPASGGAGVSTFTASDGVATDATSYTRRWLLSGTSIGTGTTVVPLNAGLLELEVTATGLTGSTTVKSAVTTISTEYGDLVMAAPSRIAYFPLDETTGAAFVDKVGNRQAAISNAGTGVLLNQAGLIVGGARPSAGFVAASAGRALVPPASMGALAFDGKSPFTISALVKPNLTRSGASTRYPLLSSLSTGAAQGFELRMFYNTAGFSGVSFEVVGAAVPGNQTRVDTTAATDVPNDVSSLITVTYDGSGTHAGMKIYVNGILRPTSNVGTGLGSATITPATGLTIGGNAAGQYYSGGLDELAVFGAAHAPAIVKRYWLSSLGRDVPADPVTKPVPLIYSQDFIYDVDSLTALVGLAGFVKRGEVEPLAIVESSLDKWVPAEVVAFCNRYGMPGVPVGTFDPPNATQEGTPHSQQVVAAFGDTSRPASTFPKATDLIRQKLAAAVDKTVVFFEGGTAKMLRALFATSGDAYSPLAGAQLFKKKVRRLVWVGGEYPSGGATNFTHDPDDTVSVFATLKAVMPEMEVIVHPHILAADVWSGPPAGYSSASDPLTLALNRYATVDPGGITSGPGGQPQRLSYDGMGMLWAVRGTEGQTSTTYLSAGEIVIAADGTNTLAANAALKQFMVGKPDGVTAGTLAAQQNALIASAYTSTGYVLENATPATLQPWTAAKEALRTSGTNARFAFVGDSTMRGTGAGTANGGGQLLTGAATKSVPARVAAAFAATGLPVIANSIFGFGGAGSIADAVAYDARLSGFTGWAGGVVSLGGPAFSTQNTNPGTYTPDTPVNRLSVFYFDADTRPPITVTKGSETFTITPSSATPKLSRAEITFATKDASPISFTRASGNSMHIDGLLAWDSTKPGVEIAGFGISGITSAGQADATSGYAPLTALGIYAPHHTLICLGANDLRTGVSLDTSLANISAIIAKAKVSGSVTVMWHTTADAAFGTPAVRAQWRDAQRALAISQGCTFIDMETFLGGQAALAASGILASDGIHLTAAGQDAEAAVIAAGLR